jgi:DNA-binding NarL/FixJ family response regulator
MYPMRVLVGALPDGVRDAVNEWLVQEPEIEVVGTAATPSALLSAAGTFGVDVVVVATVRGALPGVATHVLDQYPEVRVVAVAPQGQSALLYAQRPRLDSFSGSSLAELASALRAACHEPETAA